MGLPATPYKPHPPPLLPPHLTPLPPGTGKALCVGWDRPDLIPGSVLSILPPSPTLPGHIVGCDAQPPAVPSQRLSFLKHQQSPQSVTVTAQSASKKRITKETKKKKHRGGEWQGKRKRKTKPNQTKLTEGLQSEKNNA